ncbi:TonB-dependent receptor [Novosphingobium sp. KACC 22771]|uniref:TonB-dependent receptor n=1 Tax=Novosphingobium sp. KACC 22771 TaxID=3025670 RepID=UPI002365074F|nr:TonB-dependent receptor [Novosphingobium sp. KACC 22771]WDF74421.1 TonB-dependent receptor [Novosphingobium sp. KACC 22771]
MKAALMLAASAFALCVHPALAQSSSNGEQKGEEIIVTATKRSESLQKIPLAITAVEGRALTAGGVMEARALPQIAPSLFISTSTSESAGTQVRLRGVGTSSQNAGFEGSVGIFEDGVYLNRPGEALSDLLDVKRIEVLRGPQGTLYGKNTTTGVVNIITNEPEFTWSGNAGISYGNYNALRVDGALGGPIIADKAAFRIAAVYSRRDGYIQNVTDGRKLNNRDRYQVRGQLLLKPTDRLSIRLIGEAQEKDEACCAAPYIALGSGAAVMAAAGGTVLDPANADNRYRIALDGPMRSRVTARAFTMIANWDLGGAQAKLTYGHRYFRSSDSYDSDNSSLAVVNVFDQRLQDRLDTLELQLTATKGPADLLLGSFAYDNSIYASQSSTFGAGAGAFYNRLSGGAAPASAYPVGAGDTLQTFGQTGRGLSIFTHDVIRLAPGLKATLGLRWLTEDKQGSGTLYTDGVADSYGMALPARCVAPVPSPARAFCPANPIGGRFSDSHWTYALGLSYEPVAGTLLYFNHSTGYKAGGINAAKDARGPTTVNPALVNGTFAPETVRSFEIGAKTRAFDRRLTLAVTAFLMDFDNFQFQTRDQTTLSTQVQTAATVRSKGVEVELSLNPAKGLTLGGNAAYILARYGTATADPTLAGQRLGNSPEWTLQPFVTYKHAVGSMWEGRLNLNARYVSDYIANVTLLAGNRQAPYALVNGSLTLEHRDGLSVALFANNLFNQYYATLRTQAPLQANTFIAFPGEPRMFGITVRKAF